MRPGERITFWSGETYPLKEGITLHRLGGHFAGGTVLHWKQGAGGKGVLLSGDIITVVSDRRYVSFMYSYPNYIPLGKGAIERIVRALDHLPFERIYGAFRTTRSHAKSVVHRSAARFIEAIAEK